jgi:prepilin-type N-terminal cleavage/methylation domain-containing protein
MNAFGYRRNHTSSGADTAWSQRGITLIEIVIVVAIIAIVAVFSLPSLSPSQRRLHALQSDDARILDYIDRARFGAMNGASDWLLVLQKDRIGGQISLGPDDGWKQGMIGLNARAAMFSQDDNNQGMFDVSERGNHSLSDTERIGSINLSMHVKLLGSFGTFACPDWIAFRHDGKVETSAGVGGITVLWIADENFNATDPDMSSLSGQQEWIKPIMILPTGAVYLPFEY